MNHPLYWTAGDQIVLREVWHGKVWSAKPVTVVQDTPDLIALYMAPGTCWKQPRSLDGGSVQPQTLLPSGVWQLIDRIWMGGDALFLIIPGAAHAVYVMWMEGHRGLDCWYINLQEPLQRTALGFDYMDQILDIVISPDQSEWRWKDETTFQEAQVLGVISVEKAVAIRAEGERVIERLRNAKAPFMDGWEKWSPPSAWPIPRLAAGWEVVASGTNVGFS